VTNNFRALCADLIEAVLSDDSHIDCTEIARRARAALADEPTVPEVVGSDWQPCVKLPITVHVREQRPGEQHVSTREGITPVQSDDLIMLGVAGEEYPIGRELFQRTYRMGSADEPAVPEGRDPAAVTKQPSDAEQVLRLAAIIREVDGNHSKGAAALAESILDHPGFRVVLASWGTSNLTQTKLSPAAGEVVGLVKMLKGIAYWRLHGTDKPTPFDIRQAARLTRAADLLQRQVVVPVPVSEWLPEPSTKVLAHYFNDLGRKRTICAIWVPAKSRSGDIGDDDDFTEYDEEDGKFYWPEGWYETIENWDDLGYVKVVEGEVIYWQPLPKWHAHALPLPEVGE